MNSLISRLVLRISYIRDMKEHLGKLEQTVGELQEDAIALAGEVVETRQQLAGTGQQLAETQQQLIETRERLAETRLQLADTQQQFAEKEVQIRELQEQTSVWSRFFVHSLPAKSPCDFVFAAGAEAVDSTLVSRILGVAGAQSNKKEGGGYVWDVISQEHWQHLDGLTREGMSLLAESPLTDGLLQGRALTQVLRESDQQRNHWCNAALDALLCLCEAMEVIEVEDIELGVRHQVTKETPDELLDTVSRLVGFEVLAPDIFTGLFGLETARGVFTFRHFIALYVAWRLAQTYPEKKSIRIGEIGAGAGLVAYYAWQFGFRDYSIFDLPTVNVVQSWFLGQSLPEAPLILGDEPDSFAGLGIRVLSPDHLQRAPETFWDVVVNIDSMPEIAPEIVTDYLELLRSRTSLIYSYNQEARPSLDGQKYLGRPESFDADFVAIKQRQEPMAWHVSRCGGYERLSRNRAWLRPGYVEEWYESLDGRGAGRVSHRPGADR